MTVNTDDPRVIELTVDRLNWIILSIDSSIRYYEELIKKSKEPESVKDVYRSIVSRYEKESDYLKKVLYQESEQLELGVD